MFAPCANHISALLVMSHDYLIILRIFSDALIQNVIHVLIKPGQIVLGAEGDWGPFSHTVRKREQLRYEAKSGKSGMVWEIKTSDSEN